MPSQSIRLRIALKPELRCFLYHSYEYLQPALFSSHLIREKMENRCYYSVKSCVHCVTVDMMQNKKMCTYNT